jgi:hypothetical protein
MNKGRYESTLTRSKKNLLTLDVLQEEDVELLEFFMKRGRALIRSGKLLVRVYGEEPNWVPCPLELFDSPIHEIHDNIYRVTGDVTHDVLKYIDLTFYDVFVDEKTERVSISLEGETIPLSDIISYGYFRGFQWPDGSVTCNTNLRRKIIEDHCWPISVLLAYGG